MTSDGKPAKSSPPLHLWFFATIDFHGKEGVDGSSPSEGLQNPRSRGFSLQNDLLFVVRAVGMEPFMELSRRERRVEWLKDALVSL